MKIIKPKKLQINDTIGLLSVSGALNDEHKTKLENAKKFFQSKGFKVKISQNSYSKNNYLAGSDEERKRALESFFADDMIKAIIATRGGYGSLRILDKIDYTVIKKNPKIFIGYSDITALLWKIFQQTGLQTFHGPMACPDFGNEIDNFTKDNFEKIFYKKSTQIEHLFIEAYTDITTVDGILCPMNLATLSSLNHFDLILNQKIILMLEDINEPAYKVDRMMTSLFRNTDFKKQVKAIVLGNFSELDNKKYFYQFWQNFYHETQIPVTFGTKFGHEREKLTIPFGTDAKIDFQNKKLIFEKNIFT